MIWQTLKRPTGRVALWLTGVAVLLFVVSNVMATWFWHQAGGVGLLDTDGGANLFSASTAISLPPAGTADRVLAIAHAYSSSMATTHIWLTCSLDLIFPLAVALMGWTVVAWAVRPLKSAPLRKGLSVIGAVLAVSYLVADWSENASEVLILTGADALASIKPYLSQGKMTIFGALAVVMFVSLACRLIPTPGRLEM